MLLRIRPLINAGLRRLGRDVDAERASVEVTVLSPEEIQPAPAPVFLPNQLGKVTAAIPGVEDVKGEMDLAHRPYEIHAPLIRYTLKHCLVHEAGFDGPGGSVRKKKVESLRFLTESTRHLREAVYCMSDPSHLYFAHWLRDSCATALLAHPGEATILDVRADWSHARPYVDALGLSPAASGQYAVDRLTFYQDHGLGVPKRGRWEEMRRRLRQAIPDRRIGGPAVYFRRGRSGAQRLVANEDAVVDALVRRGFEVFDIEGATMEDLQQRFRNAQIVVSMEGSHLCHVHMSMPAGASIVALIPADRFTLVQMGYARAIGARFAFVVVTPVQDGYQVDLGELLKTVELAGA